MSSERPMPAGRVLEISVSCRHLRDMDWFSRSDPFVVLFIHPGHASRGAVRDFLDARADARERAPAAGARESLRQDSGWEYAGETEVVWNELSPDFVVKFYLPLDAPGVSAMPLRFEVYDMDKFDAPLCDQDFLGAHETSVASLLEPRAGGGRRRAARLADRRLRPRAKLGELLTAAEVYDVAPPPHNITFHTCFAINSGIPDGEQVFFVLSRALADAAGAQPDASAREGWTPVYRSGPVHRPRAQREWGFQDVTLSEDHLTAGKFDRKLRVELFFHRKNGRHVRLGCTRDFTFEDLERGEMNGTFRMDPDRKSGAGLQSASIGVTPQLCGKTPAEAEATCGPVLLASAGSSVRSSLAGLDSSSIEFRFSNFLWYSKGKKEGGFLKPLKAVRVHSFPI